MLLYNIIILLLFHYIDVRNINLLLHPIFIKRKENKKFSGEVAMSRNIYDEISNC